MPSRTVLHRLFSVAVLLLPTFAVPQVKIGNTTLVGRNVTLLQQDFFGGIPFAEPPVGNLRFEPPVLKTQLNVSTFDASQFGQGCIQPASGKGTDFSEDCLTINVFRPSAIDHTAKLPVMFWTYGGGFKSGVSSIFNASGIVRESMLRGTPVVYVNFNYRLGPLGFPQGQEAGSKGSVNLALKDQLAALQWVQANIESFGGDKSKVTVFGESAGAIMTAILLLNPSIENLARAAILESGSAATVPEFKASDNQADWQNFVSGVPSCSSLSKSNNTFDCLKKANTSELTSGLLTAFNLTRNLFPFAPTIDGPGGLLPDVVSRLMSAGNYSKLPFIAGTNLDEGTVFLERSMSEAATRALLISAYAPSLVEIGTLNATVNELLRLYPDDPALGSPYNTGNETFGLPGYKRVASLLGDISFQSQRRSLSQITSRAGVKSYAYLFTQPQPNSDPSIGVYHSSEIVYVYGAPTDRNASALALSNNMADYWISFATSLDPNDGKGSARPIWPQYTPENEVLLQFNGGNTTTIPDNYRKEQIDFINSNPLVFRHRRSL